MNNKLVKQMGNPVGDQDGVNKLTMEIELAKKHDKIIDDLDMHNKNILNVENLPDHKIDDAYPIIVKDVKSVVNKDYINLNCMKKNGNDFDLKNNIIKNSAIFDGDYDDQSLVPKNILIMN